MPQPFPLVLEESDVDAKYETILERMAVEAKAIFSSPDEEWELIEDQEFKLQKRPVPDTPVSEPPVDSTL
jgi:hypothetical protein